MLSEGVCRIGKEPPPPRTKWGYRRRNCLWRAAMSQRGEKGCSDSRLLPSSQTPSWTRAQWRGQDRMPGAGAAKGATSELSLMLYVWQQQYLYGRNAQLGVQSPTAERRFNCGPNTSASVWQRAGWGTRFRLGKGEFTRVLGSKEKARDSGPRTLMLQDLTLHRGSQEGMRLPDLGEEVPQALHQQPFIGYMGIAYTGRHNVWEGN